MFRRRGQVAAVSVGVRVDDIDKDPAVRAWLARLPDSEKVYLGQFRRFVLWLRARPGWEGVMPSELIERQDNAKTKAERYAIVDQLQVFVNSHPAKAYKSRVVVYSAGRSFFAHNRSSLPDDPTFRIRGEKEPTKGLLTVPDVLRMVNAAKLRDRSAILVKWMGLLDNKGLEWINTHEADHIVSEIRAGKTMIRLDLPGRKHGENRLPYYTFIGKDAIDALADYFEKERPGGWPRKGEPLWYDQYGLPLSRTAFAEIFMALSRRVGLVPKEKGSISTRYGYGSHEMRDAAKTWLHVKAKVEGFDMDVTQLMMGHVEQLDKDKYDKFYEEETYTRKHYLIAEPHLNIVSGVSMTPEKEKEFEAMRSELDDLKFRVQLLQDASGLRVDKMVPNGGENRQ